MPDRLNPAAWQVNWTAVAEACLFIAVAIGVALLLHRIVFATVSRIARLSSTTVDDLVVARVSRPVRWIMVVIGISIAANRVVNRVVELVFVGGEF